MKNRPTEAPDLNALAGLAHELASTFVALSSDIALVIDADGAIRNVLQGAAPLTPSAHEWVGQSWADTVTGNTRTKIEQLLQDVGSTGIGRQREVNLPGSAGADIPVSYAAIRLGDHGPVLAVGRDLRAIAAIQQRFTESQQEMERDYWKRRQAEARYRLLFQVATDAVLVVDALTLGIVEANRAAGQLFGLPHDQLVGKHATVGIARHSWPAVEDLLTSARATGRAAEIRARLAGASGSIDISATPFRSERDLLLLVRARAVAPRPAGAGAATSSVNWADLVEHLPDAVVITDSSGRVIMANPAFVELCQLVDDAQADGRSLAQWLADAGGLADILAQARRGGISPQATVQLHGAKGRQLSVGVSAVLLDEGDRESVGFTLRRLAERDGAAQAGVDDLATSIDALAALMGRKPLPELLHEATTLVERHLVKSALQRSGGDAHAAAALLGISAETLALRVHIHALSAGEGAVPPSQIN